MNFSLTAQIEEVDRELPATECPSLTLGRPLVSPGFAGCQVPADRRQRMGESGGAAADLF